MQYIQQIAGTAWEEARTESAVIAILLGVVFFLVPFAGSPEPLPPGTPLVRKILWHRFRTNNVWRGTVVVVLVLFYHCAVLTPYTLWKSNQLVIETNKFELTIAQDEIHEIKPVITWSDLAAIAYSEWQSGKWDRSVTLFDEAIIEDRSDWLKDRVLVTYGPCYYSSKFEIEMPQISSSFNQEKRLNEFRENLLALDRQIKSAADGGSRSGYGFPDAIQGNLNCLNKIKTLGLPDRLTNTEVDFRETVDGIIQRTQISLQHAKANWPNLEKEK